MTMLITDARNRLRIDLSDVDTASELMSTDVLDRGVQRAVSDLSRFLPLEQILEVTLVFTVTNENWISAAAAGTYVDLGYKPIKHGSETVKNAVGTACVRDTDYYMDYSLGKITHISGGRIGDAEGCTISYTKSEITIDISSIVDDLIRVERVEYPIGDVPQSFVTYDIWKNMLTVIGGRESQAALTGNKHIAVHYKAKHTMPTDSADGSYPSFLDDTVILAASAYALFSLALSYESQAVTDMASSRTLLGTTISHAAVATALGNAGAKAALAGTALGKVTTYLETNTDYNAKSLLEDITTAMHTAVTTMAGHADAVLTQLASEVSITEADLNAIYTEQKKFMVDGGYADIEAEVFLEAGVAKANLVNLGSRVAEIYGEYAAVSARLADVAGQVGGNLASLAYAEAISFSAIASSMSAAAASLAAAANAASVLLNNNRTYIEEAAGWNRIAETFVAEASQRIGEANVYVAEAQARMAEIDRYLAESAQYQAAAGTNLVMAEKIRVEAIERRNEAWIIWRDKSQYIGEFSIAPVRQTSQ